MSENIHLITDLAPQNPNTLALTKRGKAAAWVAGLGLAVAAGAGLNSLYGASDSEKPAQTESVVCYDDQNTKEVIVRPGEGVDAIVARTYGVEDSRTVMNNECYDEQVAAIEAQIGDDFADAGEVLNVPVDIYPADQLPK